MDPMTAHEAIAYVLVSPDLPVEVAWVDPEYPGARPIPWPRERITVPAWAPLDYSVICRCNGPKLDALNEPYAPFYRKPITAIRGFRYVYTSRTRRGDARVYLGQCADCGRIYWDVIFF
jgi:hypothetical protein